mgnify:CR=1 FL=1
MDKVQQMQILCAKIGVFFANCDGLYDSRESQFIENFLVELEQDGNISQEVKIIIQNCTENIEPIDNIISMTRDLLDGLNEVEQSEIKKVLAELIIKLIEVDGEIHPNELANYNIWKEQIGLE